MTEGAKIDKQARAVTIRTTDGRTISGNIFLLSTERVSDFVNGHPKFVPVESNDQIEIVNKEHIISIVELRELE